MIDAELIAKARDADLLVAAQDFGAQLKRTTSTEWAGPCPRCGGDDRFSINTRKRLWHCRGCAQGGSVIDLARHVIGMSFAEAVASLAGAPAPRARPTSGPYEGQRDDGDNRDKALALWRRRQPLEGRPACRYLREARGYNGPIPATLGFLPARGENPPAMIAAFGVAEEPEPGALAIRDEAIRAVHLTSLRPDGSGKAGTGADKVTIGQGALGSPIVVAPVNDLLGLAITEGIEDALSVFAATGLGVWAAGAAGRMPALAQTVPAYVERVTVLGHRDDAGERGARALAARLVERGLETVLKFLEEPEP
jgi:hypothetical protein